MRFWPTRVPVLTKAPSTACSLRQPPPSVVAAQLPDQLDAIDLTRNRITDAGIAALTRRASDRALRFSINATFGAAAFDRLLRWRPLSALHLSSLPTVPALDVLLTSRTLPALHALDLGRCEVLGAQRAEILAKTPFTRLTRLRLAHGRFGPRGAAHLAKAPPLRALVALDLSGSRIEDAGVEAITTSEHLNRLCTLDLSHCRLTDRALHALAQWPHLHQITTLRLRNNAHITRAGLDALARAPRFDPVALDLSGMLLDQQDARILRRRFPGLVHRALR